MLDLLMTVASVLLAQPSVPVCTDAVITSPEIKGLGYDTRPAITWRPGHGTAGYRVEIESRTAEGRVLASIDTHVNGTLFRPPTALTDSRAVVKVRVTSGCPADDGSQLRAQTASFFIDTAPLCAGPARIEQSQNARSIEWAPTPNAARYDVTLLRPDGTQVTKGQTQRPEFALPAGNEALVAIVRPYCATGFGPYASALIPVAQR